MSANCYPAIIADLGSAESILWVSLVYTLAVATGILVLSRLSDIFGRRWFVVGGNFLSVIGGIIGGTAKNLPSVIGGMALIGLAAAVQLNFPMAIGERMCFSPGVLLHGLTRGQSCRKSIAPYGTVSFTHGLSFLWGSDPSSRDIWFFIPLRVGDGAFISISSSRVTPTGLQLT
jgi:MFS family permease